MNARNDDGRGRILGIPLRLDMSSAVRGAAAAMEGAPLRTAMYALLAECAASPDAPRWRDAAVLASMLWWACFLVADTPAAFLPARYRPAGRMRCSRNAACCRRLHVHFLLTVFPRWMNQPAWNSAEYVPVFAGIFAGFT